MSGESREMRETCGQKYLLAARDVTTIPLDFQDF